MEELTYKIAELRNYDDFYKIKCDPENVKWSGFATAPDYTRMKEWFIQQLNNDKRTIYLCYWNGEICGFFYLDKLSKEEFEVASSMGGYETIPQVDIIAEEIGYGVLKGFSGRGIGTAIVGYACQICESPFLMAWVSEYNNASERCFEKNGFERLSIKEQRNLSLFTEPHNFFCWIKGK